MTIAALFAVALALAGAIPCVYLYNTARSPACPWEPPGNAAAYFLAAVVFLLIVALTGPFCSRRTHITVGDDIAAVLLAIAILVEIGGNIVLWAMVLHRYRILNSRWGASQRARAKAVGR